MSHYFPEFFFQKETKPSCVNEPITDDFLEVLASLKDEFPTSLMRSRQSARGSCLSYESAVTTDSVRDALLAMVNEGSSSNQSNDQKMLVEIDGHKIDLMDGINLDDDLTIGSLLDDEVLELDFAPSVLVVVEKKETLKRQRSNGDIILEERQYTTPTDSDVCLGRGGWTNKHPGNRQFHEWKKLLMADYFAIAKKLDRTPVAQRLLDLVYQNNGRFLNKDKHGWYEIGTKKAREKCSQALRDSKITAEDRALKRQKYPKKKNSGKK